MSKEINRIASEYLARLLSQNPSTEFQKVLPVMHLCSTEDYSDEDAERFVSQIQTESERIEISEPASVIIMRRCARKLPAFLAGIRHRKPVWTYHQHLAQVLSGSEKEEILGRLKGYGFECFVLPAPEIRHRTL